MAENVNIVITAVDKFSKILGRAERGFDTFGGKLSKVSSSLSIFRTGAVAGIGGVAAGLFSAVKASTSFESAFAGVRKTADLTEQEFGDLEQRFRDLSKTIPTSFEDLSKIGELAGQLGVSGVDNLEKFTTTIADISVSTNLTKEAAATAFARIANVMQEPLTNVDRMGSAVVELGNNFATTESEILDFGTRIAGAGKIAGLTTQDTFAIGTAFSSVGVQAEAGGTAVQKVLLAMTDAAVGTGENLEKFAAISGQSTEEFKKSFEDDAAGSFATFVEGLGSAGNDAIGMLDDLGLSDQRLVRGFLSVANAGDTLRNAIATGNKGFEENTALTEEAGKRYGTLESQFGAVGNTFKDFLATVGDELAPLFKDQILPAIQDFMSELSTNVVPFIENSVVPAIQNFIDKIKEFDFQTIITAFQTWAPFIIPVVVALTALSFILPIISAAIGIITGLMMLFNLALGPVLLIILAVAAAIAIVILIVKNWATIMAFMGKVLEVIGLGFKLFGLIFQIVWQNIMIGASNAINSLVSMFGSMINFYIAGVNKIIAALNLVPGVSIPLVPEFNTEQFQINTDSMKDKLAGLKEEAASTMGEISDFSFASDSPAPESGGGATNITNVNIEQANGLDPEDVVNAVMGGVQDRIQA